MAGGKATRFSKSTEKALLTVGSHTLLERCLDALSVDGIDEVLVATSPSTLLTRDKAVGLGVAVVETSGVGYHEDIDQLLVNHNRFMTLNVDVPFVKRRHVTKLLEAFDGKSLAAVVPHSILRTPARCESIASDTDNERFVWVGLNIVTPDPHTMTIEMDDPLLAVNINDEADLALATDIALAKGV